MMRRGITIVLVLLALAPASAVAAACSTSTWFDVEAADIDCPMGNPDKIHFSIPLASSYSTPKRVEVLTEKRGEISLQVEYLAPDLAPEMLHLTAADIVVNPTQIGITLPFSDLRKRKAIRTLRLVFPPESLYCGDVLVAEETTLETEVTDANGKTQPVVSCLVPNDREASRPLDWRVDLAPADDDAKDDPGVAVEFSFDREWGYNLHLNAEKRSWSTNLWRLQLNGSGATNDAKFYDSVTADLSWSWNRTYLDFGEGLRGRPFTSLWWSAYVRPETTFQDDVRDYVFGGRVEVLANLRTLIGTDVGPGTRPYVSLGVERVDPAKREDGSVPDNYDRATGELHWKFSPFQRIRVEADWEAKYILNKDDLQMLGLDDRLQDKLEVSVALDVTGKREFLPFLKYSRGAEAPRFDVVKEVLFGFAWDRLFPGEKPE